MFRGLGTSGFLNWLCRLTTLSGCIYLVWKIYFRREIAYLGWSTMDRGLASSARECGGIRRENGNSSRSLHMSITLPPLLLMLHLCVQ
jgi:hypothetical protein